MSVYSFWRCQHLVFCSTNHRATATIQASRLTKDKEAPPTKLCSISPAIYLRNLWHTRSRYVFPNSFRVLRWLSSSSSPTKALLVTSVVDSKTRLSVAKIRFSSLQGYFNASANCLHCDVPTTFSVSRVFKRFLFTASTWSFLTSISSAILPDHQENRRWYPKPCIKESRAALSCLLHVSDKFWFNFCCRSARFETASTFF